MIIYSIVGMEKKTWLMLSYGNQSLTKAKWQKVYGC